MPRLSNVIPALAIAGVLGGAALAASHSETHPAVKARTSHMSLYAFSLGVLGNMAKGETEYDAALAQAAADRLVALSGYDQTGYWPQGTSTDELEGTRALPPLFDNLDEYDALTADLNKAAMEMAAIAGDGAEAIGGQMKAVGGACGACHEDYRQSED